MPHRGSWYVCFSAMNFEPAVYMSKIFFPVSPQTARKNKSEYPQKEVFWICFVSRLFSELVWWLVMDTVCADWDHTRAREDIEGRWVLWGALPLWRSHVLIPHSPMSFFTLEAKLLTEVNPFATLLIKIVTLTQIHERSRCQGGNSLRASSPGREKVGELATTSLEFDFHLQLPCGFPSTELSDFRQSARSGNERKCKQTLKNRCQG